MARSGRIGARTGERESVVSGIAAEAAGAVRLGGPVLVVDDASGAVEARIDELGIERESWHRRAWSGVSAAPWPPEKKYQEVMLRLPRDWGSFKMQRDLLAARLLPSGRLFVYGANDEGIRSAEDRLLEVFSQVHTRVNKRRARVLEARDLKDEAVLNGHPDAWKQKLRLAIPLGNERTEQVQLVTWPGVFAAGRLDEGTECLLRALDRVELEGDLLDFGCGHGVLSVAARLLAPSCLPVMLDVDAVALEAARENLPGAEIVLSDGWAGLDRERRFDVVLSNPPIHRGRDEDFAACEALVRQARRYLRPRGILVTVTQKTVGIGKLFQRAFRRSQVLLETPRFQVWRGRA